MPDREIHIGDKIRLEVEVWKAWHGARVTFRLGDYDIPITIPVDAKEIIAVIPGASAAKKRHKNSKHANP